MDIEEIDRFSEKKYEENQSFYSKIFTSQEIEYCLSKPNPYPHFAVRFCAKEAAIKAFDRKLRLTEIEVYLKNKKPFLKTSLLDDDDVSVSLSHSKNFAVAVVNTS